MMDRTTIYERLEDSLAALDEQRHTELFNLEVWGILIYRTAERLKAATQGNNSEAGRMFLRDILTLAMRAAEEVGVPALERVTPATNDFVVKYGEVAANDRFVLPSGYSGILLDSAATAIKTETTEDGVRVQLRSTLGRNFMIKGETEALFPFRRALP